MTSLRTGIYVDSDNLSSFESRAFIPGFLTTWNEKTAPGNVLKPIT